jgi:hypothetical protein
MATKDCVKGRWMKLEIIRRRYFTAKEYYCSNTNEWGDQMVGLYEVIDRDPNKKIDLGILGADMVLALEIYEDKKSLEELENIVVTAEAEWQFKTAYKKGKRIMG